MPNGFQFGGGGRPRPGVGGGFDNRGALANLLLTSPIFAPVRQAIQQQEMLGQITGAPPLQQRIAERPTLQGLTQPRVAQAAPTAAPGAPPVTPTPTGAVGQITEAPTEAKKGITDQQRQLLAMALQVGLPLALAGFGGGRGLAMGAGLATGFGEAAIAGAETEEKQLERQAKEKQQDIENRLKVIEEARKQAEAQRKETELRLKALKETAKGKGPKGIFRRTTEERMREAEALIRPGERIAGKVKKVTKETLPAGVTEEDIQFTMKKHKLTREQVLKKIK